MTILRDNHVLNLQTIQPYLAFNAYGNSHVKVAHHHSPISHFYYFETSLLKNQVVIVPDASVEIMFLCDEDDPKAYLYGSPLQAKELKFRAGKRYFGVRFHPGKIPDFLTLPPKLLTNAECNLSEVFDKADVLLEKIVQARTFEEQIIVFNHFFLGKIALKTSMLASQIHQFITAHQGVLQMRDKERYLGYSSSYINRVFTENSGISPKTYALILRFQSNLKKMLTDQPVNLTDLASEQGYADQSHFFREFRRFTSSAPSLFLKKASKELPLDNLF